MAKTKLGLVLAGTLLASAALTLAFIVFNPARRLVQKQNALRRQHLETIASAMNKANLNITLRPGDVFRLGSHKGQLNFCSDLVPKYLDKLPVDPLLDKGEPFSCQNFDTGYQIVYPLKLVALFADMLAETSGEKEVSVTIAP